MSENVYKVFKVRETPHYSAIKWQVRAVLQPVKTAHSLPRGWYHSISYATDMFTCTWSNASNVSVSVNVIVGLVLALWWRLVLKLELWLDFIYW